ncbi:CAAX protease self-immunity [Arenibacter troitsensis]|uniref:CAAX protease self-immunity n=2 Tax=Arenibacter troitsensis TaxID=188872 RepID=A0A1X7KZF2_9FLAO|nr:CAAX protease self-immunity [Arenibacter troitsensis]
MKDFFTLSIVQDKEGKKRYRWQIAITLLILFIFGSLINIPFSREVKRLKIEAGLANLNLKGSIYDELLTIGSSSLVLGTILIFIGLWVSSRANLGAPLLVSFFSKQPTHKTFHWKALLLSMFLATIVVVLLLVAFEVQKEFYPVSHKLTRPSKPFYALVSFSAGISEEIIFRLGLMSLIITVIQFLKKSENPSNKMIWTGIIISAIVFGLVHLPLSKNFVEPTPFSIGITVIGNLITGSTFGWIFWKRGLLIAILSHITFDLVFHVIGTPFG